MKTLFKLPSTSVNFRQLPSTSVNFELLRYFRYLIFTFATLFLLFSCTDNSLENVPIDTKESKLRTEQQLFLAELTKEIQETKIPKSGTINPENLNNFMDDFGNYFGDMLLAINQSENQFPSQDQAEYSAKWEDYLTSNPILYDFTNFIVTDWEFYAVMVDIIKTINDENSLLTIEQLKTYENIVAETTFLTDIEKEGLLALTAFKKYTLATMILNGLVVGDVVIEPNTMPWCFEDKFLEAMEECLHVLVDYDNPVLMIIAWADLPMTIAGCEANSVYVAIVKCW